METHMYSPYSFILHRIKRRKMKIVGRERQFSCLAFVNAVPQF